MHLTYSRYDSWAVVFARVMQTSWATYTIWRTEDVKFRYETLIVDNGTPCHFDIMPSYFATRLALQVSAISFRGRTTTLTSHCQIPELVLNVTALISTTFLAWHIVKVRLSALSRVETLCSLRFSPLP